MTRHARTERSGGNEVVATVVDALATYRVTRLLVSDGIIDRPRDALLQHLRDRNRNKLVELVECPWCLGFWVAGAVVIARRTAPALWGPAATVLAFSAGAGIVASAVRSMDDQHSVTEGREPAPAESTPRRRAANASA